MKLSHPIGLIVLGAGLGGFAAIFGPIFPEANPISSADGPISPADGSIFPVNKAIANTNDQDGTKIVITGFGNSGNNFNFNQSNDSGHVFVHVEGVDRVSDETLVNIFLAVRSEALHGDAQAARLIAEIASSQREHEELNSEDDQSGDENEPQ